MICCSAATMLVRPADHGAAMLSALAVALRYDIRAIKRTDLRKP